jgi:gamma-glutamyl:cysteine ligase YbdK (ATP-grasp superfamily)
VSGLHLFEAYGIELEYMIVDGESLDVRPIADEVLKQAGGGYELEVERGPIAWSNELALHVIELKTNGPVSSLAGVAEQFDAGLSEIEQLLSPMSARILPSAMHPWMDPHRELRLWPHENDVIYQTFDRIFDCKGHGWANLQSMHINLPFQGDDEFGRLHAAIRLALPILPALSASSPLSDGLVRPDLDTRLAVYRHNAARIPSVTGLVVPEAVFTRGDYERVILQRIYDDMAELDPDGVLRDEWVNARGCIARFDRMAIEIRVLDVQECPKADLSIAEAVTRVVKAIAEERFESRERQRGWDERRLSELLTRSIRDADEALIEDAEYLALFGFPGRRAQAKELWQHLIESVVQEEPGAAHALPQLATLLEQGCLARRIRRALGPSVSAPDRASLREVYASLADCLREGRMFVP